MGTSKVFFSLLWIICALCSTGKAEEITMNGQATRGQLVLKNRDGKLVALRNGPIKVEVVVPNLFTSPVQVFTRARLLRINDTVNEFDFRLPQSLRLSELEFSVHQTSAEQTAHVISTIQKTDLTSAPMRKWIRCIYQIQSTSTADMIDQYGQQLADVIESRWTEVIEIQIFNESGAVILRTQPAPKVKNKLINQLSMCQ